MIKDAASDVATFLDGEVAGALTLDLAANLFIGQMRLNDRTNSPAVFCLGTGGAAPEPYIGGHRESLLRPMVQVMVRGAREEHEAGEAIARGLYELLHMQVVTGYVSWNVREAAPVFLGVDAEQRGRWVLNLECVYRLALS